jgi:DNA-binding NarL/FixJ family response regulator
MEMRPLVTALEQLAPRDHLCSIYESPEEHYAVAIPFIQIGLGRGEKCIYIADDGTEDAVRDAMCTAGIDVERAIATESLVLENKEALAKHLQPDIVVMDLSLPELNGLDATRHILKESPRSEILVLTMHHSEELAREVLHAGARGYVLKSDADQSLIAAIESLRQHKPFLTSTVTEFVLDDYVRRSETDDDGVSTVPAVTAREREIIQVLAEGKSNKEAASTLGISVKTIEAHRANIMRKLRFRSVSDLVRYAIRNKIVQP